MTLYNKFLQCALIILLTISTLTACGGGGSDADVNPSGEVDGVWNQMNWDENNWQ